MRGGPPMEVLPVIGALERTRELLFEHGWTRGGWYDRNDGYCLVGAVADATDCLIVPVEGRAYLTQFPTMNYELALDALAGVLPHNVKARCLGHREKGILPA